MRSRKGFTLIELLAVIVILAIIALIATPLILGIIGDTRKSSNERSIELYLNRLQTEIASKNMKEEFNPSYCEITDGVLSCEGEELKITENDAIESGEVNLENGKVVSYYLKVNGEDYYSSDTDTSCFVSIIPGEINDYVCTNKNIIIPSDLKLGVSTIESIEFDDEMCAEYQDLILAYNSNYTCSILKNQFDSLKNSNVEQIYGSFLGAFAIAEYGDASSNLNNITKVGSGAFAVGNLESVTIGKGITQIGSFSFNNNNISYLHLNDDIIEIGEVAFRENKISSINIPNNLTKIGAYAFEHNNITNVIIPSKVTEIGREAFFRNLITNIDFSKADSLNEIGAYSFNSNKLQSVTIPNSVARIEDYAFNSNNLTEVIIGSGIEFIGEYSFSDSSYTYSTTNVKYGPNAIESVRINIPKNLDIFDSLEYTFGQFNANNIVWKSN